MFIYSCLFFSHFFPLFSPFHHSPDEDANSNPQFSSPQTNRHESKSNSENSSDFTIDPNKINHTVSTVGATVATPQLSTTSPTTTTTTTSPLPIHSAQPKTTINHPMPSVTCVQVNNTPTPISTINTTELKGNKTPVTLGLNHSPVELKTNSQTQSSSMVVQAPSMKRLTLECTTSNCTTTTTTTTTVAAGMDQEPNIDLKRPRLDNGDNDTDHIKPINDEISKQVVNTTNNTTHTTTTTAATTSSTTASATTGNKQRKRRIRLFTEEEKSPKSGLDIAKSSSLLQQNKKSCFTPESSPPKTKLTVESTDHISSCVQNQSAAEASFAPYLITTADQLGNAPKIQFVCSNLVDGPIIVQLINSTNSSTRGEEIPKLSNSMSRIIASRSDRRLWELICTDRLTSYAYSDEVIAVGDNKGRIQLIYSTGGHICPNLLLDCVHTLALTTETNESSLSTCSRTFSSSSSYTESTTTTTNNSSSNNLSRLHAVVSGNEQQRTTYLNGNQNFTFPNINNNNNNHNHNHNNSATNKFNINRKYRLAALCRSGKLILWNFCLNNSGLGSMSTIFNTCIFPQVLIETNIRDVLN
ncbi:unnamed protein product, partial [Schistosoma turkestanicum]